MSPVNEKDSEGLPVFYIKNIPSESSVGFKVENPAIYFGEEADNYAVVDSAKMPEFFDYPEGRRQRILIPIWARWRHPDQWALSARALQLLLSRHQLAGHREHRRAEQDHDPPQHHEPLGYLAQPFLHLDSDPYVGCC